MTVEKPKLAYNLPEAAAACGVSVDTVIREIHAGRLVAVYLRGRRVIPVTSLQAWVDRAPAEPPHRR